MLPQSPSMLSLRGPEFEDRLGDRDGKLPPIRQETDTEPFFQRWHNTTECDITIIIPMQARLQGQRLLHEVREQTEHQQSRKVEFLVYLDVIGRRTLLLDYMLWTMEFFS